MTNFPKIQYLQASSEPYAIFLSLHFFTENDHLDLFLDQ